MDLIGLRLKWWSCGGTVTPSSPDIYTVRAGGVYVPGPAAAMLFSAGPAVADTFIPGVSAAQVGAN